MQTLASYVKDIPGDILSSIIVESTQRFHHKSVLQLLDPQSAISCILSQGMFKQKGICHGQFYHYAFVMHWFAVFIHCTLCGSTTCVHPLVCCRREDTPAG